MKKYVYLPLCFLLAKTSSFRTIPFKSTKNEPRYMSSFNVYPGCFPVLRTGYLNHIFPQLSSWSYTPLALFPKGANLMSCPSLLSWFTTLQATAERAPTVGEGTQKKHNKKRFTTNISQKKNHRRIHSLFLIFFLRVVFPTIHGIFANLSDVMMQGLQIHLFTSYIHLRNRSMGTMILLMAEILLTS